MSYRILVVETDVQTTRTICHYLKQEGLTPNVVTDSPMAEAALRHQEPHLVIVDTKSTNVDWREMRKLVRQWSTASMLLLLGPPGKIDKDVGLLIGPGDYLTRPFGRTEFIAAVKGLLHSS